MIGIQTQQILLPKKVYIGDSAELRCTFNSNSLSIKNFVANNTVQLSLEGFQNQLNFHEYNIQKIQLSPTGVDYYQLSITFVPWKTGTIQLPSYDIAANFNQDESFGLGDKIIINFEPVNIVSIVEQNAVTGLRGFTSPLLLPGTAYKLYSGCIGFIVFVILLIRIVIKRKELAFYFKNRKLQRFYRKNRRFTEHQLKKLITVKKGKTPVSDKEFCEKFQLIIRNYLETRFSQPFTKCVTSQMMLKFYSAFGGTDDFSSMISEAKENAATKLVGTFIRTDFIRYSKDGTFNESERTDLVNAVKESIAIFEGDSKKGEADV